MSDEPEVIRPVFRVAPEGDVIALWGDPDKRGMVSSYQHVGQHSDASSSLLVDWRQATEEEAAPLKAELERIGYRVEGYLRKYCVTLMANATMFNQQWVDAENKEQAEAFALAHAPTDPANWGIEPDTSIKDVEVGSAEEWDEEMGNG